MGKRYLIIMVWMACFTGCGLTDEQLDPPEDLKTYVHQQLYTRYLWRQELPELNKDDYATAQELLDAGRNELDRWSSIKDREQFENQISTASYAGYGFWWGFDGEGILRIIQSFGNTPARANGLTRGTVILEVNGEPVVSGSLPDLGASEVGVSNTFLIESVDGSQTELILAKEELLPNYVVHNEIIETTSGKVGYVVLDRFIQSVQQPLFEAFVSFHEADVKKVIVDLRYNGGGLTDVAAQLAEYIAPAAAHGKIFMELEYNTLFGELGKKYRFGDNTLVSKVEEIVFLTSDFTASASEMLINGVRPFTNVQLVGNPTYGKPVGSLNLGYQEKVLSMIMFRTVNSEGLADYFDGLPVDFEAEDDFRYPFGSTEDPLFGAALAYLEFGDYAAFSGGRRISNPYPLSYAIEDEFAIRGE